MASNKKDEAVERLLNADKKTYTGKKDPGKAYRSSFLDKIPNWILAVFVKFWFAGAVCFFILWGLGGYINCIALSLIVRILILPFKTC